MPPLADRLQWEIDQAEAQSEIEEIRARADKKLEMPLVDPKRRAEYLELGEQEIARLERLQETLQ